MKASLTQFVLVLAFFRSLIIKAIESVCLTSLLLRFKDKYAKASLHGVKYLAALCLATQFVMLSGCAAFSATVGVREPDLTRIHAGDTRDKAEDILGERLWRPGSADGLTYDIYQYERDRPANPFMGLTVLALDFYTAGISELAFGQSRKFAPVDQVAVAYDEQGRVRFVSEPWEVSDSVGPCRRMRSLLPTDCGVPSTARPSSVDRASGAASQLAVLEMPKYIHATIDSQTATGPVVELSPGSHTVHYQTTLGVSITLGHFEHSYDASAEVELLPGRLYRLKNERFYYGWPRKYADVFWIEDVQSGETLSCVWPGAGTNCERVQYAGGETLRCN